MAEYLSPGVYVEEIDNAPRSIEGVGTSVAGFVGMAEKGPTFGANTAITNFAQFQNVYGGFLSEFTHGSYRFLAYAVEQFFANGGTRCFVSRVVPSDAKKASFAACALNFEAANEGKWGNRIQLTFATEERKKMQLIEKLSDTVYKAKNAQGFHEGDIVHAVGEYNRIAKIYDEEITFEQAFSKDVVDTALVPKTVVFLVETDVTVRYNESIEKYSGLSFNPVSANYIINKMSVSELVTVSGTTPEAIGNPVEMLLGGDEKGTVSLADGFDGTISNVDAGTFIGTDGGPGKRTGIQAFIENNHVSMMAVPGITDPDVVVSLIAHCENMKNRVAILDMPEDTTKIKDLVDYRQIFDSTYAAMYHPWIQVYDRAAKKPGFVPPSGAVMGVYARTDNTRGVHKAPANETIHCSGLKVNYTKGEQDFLNPEGINLIRQIPGQGIRVWGARTASSNSTFRYINVRRLFIFVEESIKANTNWVVFEPNDATLWQRVSVTINSFLESLWRTGMLAGATPAEGYYVEIGNSTMTKDDILNGRLICNVAIAPTRPAEFVIFRVSQLTAEAGTEAE